MTEQQPTCVCCKLPIREGEKSEIAGAYVHHTNDAVCATRLIEHVAELEQSLEKSILRNAMQRFDERLADVRAEQPRYETPSARELIERLHGYVSDTTDGPKYAKALRDIELALDRAAIPTDEPRVVEAWRGERKVTISVDDVLRSWGTDMDTEMTLEPRTLDTVQKAMDWLYSPLPPVDGDQSIGKLRSAAQAVVDRWDAPLWKDAPATGKYIAALRNALVLPIPNFLRNQENLKAEQSELEKFRHALWHISVGSHTIPVGISEAAHYRRKAKEAIGDWWPGAQASKEIEVKS